MILRRKRYWQLQVYRGIIYHTQLAGKFNLMLIFQETRNFKYITALQMTKVEVEDLITTLQESLKEMKDLPIGDLNK